MLKVLRLSTSRRRALLILGFTDEDFATLRRGPKVLGSRSDIGELSVRVNGKTFAVDDLVLVHGSDERALKGWLEAQGVEAAAIERAHEQSGTVVRGQPADPPAKH